MSAHLLSLMMIIGAWLMPQCTVGQIPTVCADEDSLENLRCCPTTDDGECGEDANHGQCVQLNIDGYDTNTTDVRANWPHYFTHVCECNDNYSSYDCSRCKFGHYGENCSQSQILPRPSVTSYTDEDWEEFIEILHMLRTHESGYVIILEESYPGDLDLQISNITLYKLYVWLHHYAAKDSFLFQGTNLPVDYAHFGPAFHTWHRYFHLWLEWEIQYMLKSMGHEDYHSFRLPYWDWRVEIQKSIGMPAEELFTESRLGATKNVNGFPRVVGDIVGPDGWDSFCVRTAFVICNPNISTGPLQRCPFTGNDPCSSDNPDWATVKEVNDLLAIDHFDSPPYNISSGSGYRVVVDNNILDDIEDCRKDRLCECRPFGGPSCNLTNAPSGVPVTAFSSGVHADGHIILGQGDLASNVPKEMTGQMDDPAASPNDPVFIVHHTMIDCIFEEWLRRHPDQEYPDVPLTFSTQGHQAYSYMVPFFPLHTNDDMFKLAYNFGYSCNLPNMNEEVDSGSYPQPHLPLLTLFSVVIISIVILY